MSQFCNRWLYSDAGIAIVLVKVRGIKYFISFQERKQSSARYDRAVSLSSALPFREPRPLRHEDGMGCCARLTALGPFPTSPLLSRPSPEFCIQCLRESLERSFTLLGISRYTTRPGLLQLSLGTTTPPTGLYHSPCPPCVFHDGLLGLRGIDGSTLSIAFDQGSPRYLEVLFLLSPLICVSSGETVSTWGGFGGKFPTLYLDFLSSLLGFVRAVASYLV